MMDNHDDYAYDNQVDIGEGTGDDANTALIYHAALPEDWADALGAGLYRVSTRGQTLEAVGFIHASFAEQLAPVANCLYDDLDALIVLAIDPALLDAPVVLEPPYPGSDELFPHIYGPIPISAVVSTIDWRRLADEPWTTPS